MEAPRRLYRTEEGEICEEGDPRARFLLCGQGAPLSGEDAKKVEAYLKEYDKSHAMETKGEESTEKAEAKSEAKAVEQAEVEDKAVHHPTETKAEPEEPKKPDAPAHAEESHHVDDPDDPKTGAHFPPETRRIGGSGRRGGA